MTPEIEHALHAMQPTTHTILIYDSLRNKREVLFAHLKYGQRDSKLAYVCSEETPAKVSEDMRAYGLDVEGLTQSGRLTISNYDEVYVRNGKVDSQSVIDNFAKLAWASKKEGLTGLRAAAEMSCFFQKGMVMQLAEYEHALGRNFFFPGMGICAYNLTEMHRSGYLDLLMPLLRDHARIILTGPMGSAILEPESVDEKRVEDVMHVRLSNSRPRPRLV